jgi:hypothetical protein
MIKPEAWFQTLQHGSQRFNVNQPTDGGARVRRVNGHRGVAAQIGFETNISKQSITF